MKCISKESGAACDANGADDIYKYANSSLELRERKATLFVNPGIKYDLEIRGVSVLAGPKYLGEPSDTIRFTTESKCPIGTKHGAENQCEEVDCDLLKCASDGGTGVLELDRSSAAFSEIYHRHFRNFLSPRNDLEAVSFV